MKCLEPAIVGLEKYCTVLVTCSGFNQHHIPIFTLVQKTGKVLKGYLTTCNICKQILLT